MYDDLITIVIPIFNTEQYLERCIRSITVQTYTDLEIILIDDGSTDGCASICDSWAERDHRIYVIHKLNEGQGIARNIGIDLAKGKYICFIDSDDYIAPNAIEKAYRKIVADSAEVVIFGFSSVDSSGMIVSSFVPKADDEVYRGQQVLKLFLPELIAPNPKGNGVRRFYMSACMMMYSLDLIHSVDWRFVSERHIVSEDVYSLLKLFNHVTAVAVLPEALYFCCTNVNSFSRKYQKDQYLKVKHFYVESLKLCDELGYGTRIKRRLSDPYLAYTRAIMKREVAADLPYIDRMRNLKAIVNDEVLQGVLKDNKSDCANLSRWILFFAMKYRLYNICFLLLVAKNMR